MILNVSGRTDIVAFYTKWFINRYKEGFVDVRNPFYPISISRIYFNDVDLIVFCTKNPRPIIPYLKGIKKPIIFHTTITPYKIDIEPNVKDKTKLISDVIEVSKIIGKEFTYIRYDPIFISENYQNVRKNEKILNFREFTENDYKLIGENFSKSAKENNLTVQTCFENRDLTEYGFTKGECLSHELAYILTGKKYKNWTARKEQKCNCVEMVDIGVYNSCPHFCKYCYANFNEEKVKDNFKLHDDKSSLLVGHITKEDIIKVRR